MDDATGALDLTSWLEHPWRTTTMANWDERAPAHAASPFYGFTRLIGDPQALSSVVAFDVPRLGSLTGLRGVHLQCHIGTDTVSLSRLGARMTGLDYSLPAIRAARDLARACDQPVDFVHADVYQAAEVLQPGTFDLVFTGIGALCWLPRIDQWAAVVAALLRPGGRLFLREAHPMLWALDDQVPDGHLVVEHAYFERLEPTTWDEPGTYVDTDEQFENTVCHDWNHGLGEIVNALLEHDMALDSLVEHDSIPWDALPGQMVAGADGEYRLVDRPWRLPLSYTLQATRRT